MRDNENNAGGGGMPGQANVTPAATMAQGMADSGSGGDMPDQAKAAPAATAAQGKVGGADGDRGGAADGQTSAATPPTTAAQGMTDSAGGGGRDGAADGHPYVAMPSATAAQGMTDSAGDTIAPALATDGRRSFAAHFLPANGRYDARGVLLASGAPDEEDTAQRLGLADLSLTARAGFTGAGAPEWLRAQGLELPAAPNTAVLQDDGTLAAALSRHEHLLIAPPAATDGGACAALQRVWSIETAPNCWQLPRGEGWLHFAIIGNAAPDALAKLCSVDLRPHVFAVHAIAQTLLARISAIIIRRATGATDDAPRYDILSDSASAHYLGATLQDAMQEYNGAIIGLDCLP